VLKKALFCVALLVVGLASAFFVLYRQNEAPVAAPIADSNLAAAMPLVVKLHAQWCPVCMATKSVWSTIESEYDKRVNLLILDFTDDTTTASSAAEASRLGLQSFYDEYGGRTGSIVVVDGKTKEVTAAIHGSRNLDEYRAAIDAVLASAAE
jgi:thiol-disulfide isomerase/thioredoxin